MRYSITIFFIAKILQTRIYFMAHIFDNLKKTQQEYDILGYRLHMERRETNFNQWEKYPRLNFMNYLEYDNILIINSFLRISDTVNLMKTCRQCYILFATDPFLQHVDNTVYATPKDCPFLSFEFISLNYDRFKKIKNECCSRIMHAKIEEKIQSEIRSIQNIKMKCIFDNSENILDSLNQMKEMYVKKINSLLTNLSDKNLIPSYESIFQINEIDGNIGLRNESNTQFIRKLNIKYNQMKTIYSIMQKYLKTIVLMYGKSNLSRLTTFLPYAMVYRGKYLANCIRLEFIHNFIKQHKGCHLIVDYRSCEIASVCNYNQIYSFDYNKNYNEITVLDIFLENTKFLEIYDSREKAVKYSWKLQQNMLLRYHPDSMTIETRSQENGQNIWERKKQSISK